MRIRYLLASTIALCASPALAQQYKINDWPTLCDPLITNCQKATPVVNPDGTNIGSVAGGAATTPTGTAGNPNPSVISAQGVSGGTPMSISATTLPLPAGAARASDIATLSGQLPASLGTKPASGSTSVTQATGDAWSLAPVTLATGANTFGSIANTTFGATQSGTWNLNNITGIISLPTGAARASDIAALAAQLPSSPGPKTAVGSESVTQATGDTWQVASTPQVYSTTGTIAAAGASVTLAAPGSSGAEFTINGTFVGTIAAQGCIDSGCTIPGGRLLFKSGVGSTGSSVLVGDGTATSREYRLVTGANYIRLIATAWTSGSVAVQLTAHGSPTIVFINGPVHTSEEEAVRAGRAFIATSGMQSVAAGNYVNATITNPAGSNVNAFVSARFFECNQATATTPAEWTTYTNPTTVPTTQVTPSNRMLGGTTAQMQFRYQVTTTALAGGTVGDSGTISTGGGPTPNMVMSVLVPGQTGGVSIGGGGGGFTAAQRCKVSYTWYEEARN